jgi:hypothetical protein
MSVFVGIIGERDAKPGHIAGAFIVHASGGAVELASDQDVSLTPLEARNLAALLTTAASEAEILRWQAAELEMEARKRRM